MPKLLTPPDDELGINIPVCFILRATFKFCLITGPPTRRLPTFVPIDYVLKDYVY